MHPSVRRFREHLEQDEVVPAIDLLLQVFVTYGLHDGTPLRCDATPPGAVRGVGSHAPSSSGSRRMSDTSRPSSARGGPSLQGPLPPPLHAPPDLRPRLSRSGWPSGSGTTQGVSARLLSRLQSRNLRRPRRREAGSCASCRSSAPRY